MRRDKAQSLIKACQKRVHVVLTNALRGELRAVHEVFVRPGRPILLVRFGRLDLSVDLISEGFEDGADLYLDVLQGGNDLGDSLACDVLEPTGFVDRGHRVRDLVRGLRVHIRGQSLDRLDRLEDRIGAVFSSRGSPPSLSILIFDIVMERKLNPLLFALSAVISLCVLLSASILLPHERYYRFQAHDNVTTRKADWIYERLHYDETPIDVALIGTSRMAGGLSGPLIEREFCRITGRGIHVANLAIPVTGRNMHYVLAKEALRAKSPALIVLELNDVETRRPHEGFIFIADARDILTAPIAINLNYVSDILRLPGRQATLFFQTITKTAPLRSSFDQAAYAGAHLDLTEIVIAIDGRIKSRRIINSRAQMEALRIHRETETSPIYLLPIIARQLEYRFARHYLNKIENAAKIKGGVIAYAYLPAYGAAEFPAPLADELNINEPLIDLGGDVAADHTQWLDATHFNADGAASASRRFAVQLATQQPNLGVTGCD